MSKKTKASIPDSIRSHVMSSFDCCVACGQWDATHCGHIIPESKGGQMVKENFVRLCGFCNGTQGNANVVFAEFAKLDSSLTVAESMAVIQTRRAYWARYCSAARGDIQLRPYRPA